MNTRLAFTHLPQLIVAAVAAAAIKLFYSSSSVDELGWILGPTARLVELASSVRFTFESGAGYMSADRTFLIAASCSGVNFMIAAFLMLSVEWLSSRLTARAGWAFLPAMLAVSYLTTVIVNAVRIMVALQLRSIDPEVVWLDAEQLHRVEGIVVYFGALVVLFFGSERLFRTSGRVVSGFSRRWLLPLAIYYAAALGVPVVNAAYRGQSLHREFGDHALFVVAVPILLFGLWALAIRIAARFRSEAV